MQIGKPSFKKCPACREQHRYYRGPFFVNLYPYTKWSDGETFNELPSLNKTKLQICQHCNTFFWFKQMLGGLSFNEYYSALLFFEKKYSKKNIINLILARQNMRKLLYIRLCILRKYNDRIRVFPFENYNDKVDKIPENDTTIFIDNARNLICLLKELQPKNYFLISELYRNIGKFEESKKVLFNEKDENKKSLLMTEINKRNSNVIIIESSL